MTDYILATDKSWHIEYFVKHRNELPGNWLVVANLGDLRTILEKETPKYIFFPHWSSKVDSQITSRFDCICFHMTDLPFGRGGSPLQNLIIRGHKKTKLTALKMTDVIDGGPIYFKQEMSVEGPAHEIYSRTAKVCFDLISKIISEQPKPKMQSGKETYFKRRRPSDSQITEFEGLTSLYNHIRMLDAPGYPYAFLNYKGFTYTLTDAKLKNGKELEAKVLIRVTNE